MSDFLARHNFAVEIVVSGLGGDEGFAKGRGAFSEVTGLETGFDATSIREGGYHTGLRQLLGKPTTTPLVLKRGMTLDAAFWTWVQRCQDGTYPLPYVDGTVRMFGPRGDADDAIITWAFTAGIVTKVKASDLTARSASEVPIEELSIAHEGLTRRDA